MPHSFKYIQSHRHARTVHILLQPGRIAQQHFVVSHLDIGGREACKIRKKRRNMGIGLSVCRSIVKAHGGTMSAANAPDGGAVFCFTLPLENIDMEDIPDENQG